jgi:hypothetical protein
MIQHFVFFKFKKDTPQEAIDQHLSMFAALVNQIPQIAGYTAGLTVKGEQPQRFDTTHHVIFQTMSDLALYQPHPAHQAFIAANKAYWEEVWVIDSETC